MLWQRGLLSDRAPIVTEVFPVVAPLPNRRRRAAERIGSAPPVLSARDVSVEHRARHAPVRRFVMSFCVSLVALLAMASTALAGHLPASPIGSPAACNRGTEKALVTAPLWAPLYGVPIFEPNAASLGCHHHVPGNLQR
jgi:hypothetical protein